MKMPSELIPRNLWHFIHPWLKNEDADVKKFWGSFYRESAETERRKAVNGLKFVNRTNERFLITVAHEY